MCQVSFDTTTEESILISQIVNRAISDKNITTNGDTILGLNMDIAAVHCNGCRLNLKKFLESDNSDFYHDINGIRKYLNRHTGKLQHFFMPRCAEGQ